MVKVYDMTSGTLRYELEAEAEKKSAQPIPVAEIRLDAEYCPAPALQEIVLSEPQTNKSPARHIAGLDVDSFVNGMKNRTR